MKLFLQLEICAWQNSTYSKPLLEYACSLSSDLIGAELDNNSDPSIIDIIVRLTGEADTVLILVNSQENAPLGGLQRLLLHLMKEDKIYSVILLGQNDEMETSDFLNGKLTKESDIDQVKVKIEKFAKLLD